MILIANIGNSNLHFSKRKLIEAFNKQTHPHYWNDKEEFNFRACTKDLRDDPLCVANLSEEIISPLLPKDGTPTHIYLIATNQPDLDHQYSDTIHEGEILVDLLPRLHPNVEAVSLLIYDKNPVREVEVYKYLWPKLRQLLNSLPQDRPVRYSEAGGTPHLKAAVKEALRYYLKPDQFDAQYTPFRGKGAAYSTANEYHDRYVQLRVAKRFVEAYDYTGALRVLSDVEISEPLYAGLLLARHRKVFDRDAAKLLKDTYELPNGYSVFDNYITDTLPPRSFGLSSELSKADTLHILELAALFELYLRQEEYALAVTLYFRMCEQIGQSFVRSKGLAIRKGFKNVSTLTDFNNSFPGLDHSGRSTPTLLATTEFFGGASVKAIIGCIKPTIGLLNNDGYLGINQLRNHSYFAHEPKAVTRNRIEGKDGYCPGFLGAEGHAAKVLHALGVPTGTASVYDQMNDALLTLFQQE